jgi:hypothetical protein
MSIQPGSIFSDCFWIDLFSFTLPKNSFGSTLHFLALPKPPYTVLGDDIPEAGKA